MSRNPTPSSGNQEASFNQDKFAGAFMNDEVRKELEAQWQRVCDRLRKEIGDKAFKTWFGEVELGEMKDVKDGKLRLYAPTRFVRDWVARHYGDRVLAYWQAVNTEVKQVEVNLTPPPAPRRANEVIAIPPVPSSQNSYQPPMPRMGPSIGRGTAGGLAGEGMIFSRRGRRATRSPTSWSASPTSSPMPPRAISPSRTSRCRSAIRSTSSAVSASARPT
jgi:chromosomal replication initiator protein